MDVAVEIGWIWVRALVQLLLNPFYYVGILFIALQVRRQTAFERRLFSTKLHSIVPELWRAVLWGAVAGLASSVVMAFVGATLQPEALILVWVISLLLALVRVRFLCLAYAAGIVGLLHTAALHIPSLHEVAQLDWLVRLLAAIQMPPLLALVAVLHVAEAVLVRLQGARSASPMFYESKRGKIVGGFHLNGFWPMTLFLLVPVHGGAAVQLPWQPLFGGDLWSGGWAIAGFPLLLGFSEKTLTRLPKEKVRWSSSLLVLYALLVFGLALLAQWYPVAVLPASLLCIALHEGLLLLSKWDESKRSPYFVHSRRGLQILAVLPGSPAEQLGLQTGEVIHKANGFPVASKQDLHYAMRQNSAFCKLEVINLAGQSKFVQRAMFAGEHHQLGIVLAPDQDAMYYARESEFSLFAFIRRKLTGVETRKPPTHSA